MIHAKNLERTRDRLESIMAANAGKTVEEMHNACERDNYMTAQEALEFGLIDKVIEKR
ncbi:MAG: ATP-dependent Clp protease proteolytic subunit, partial [Ruminococcus sp.]|nr:ATP-dependent Clp protease proteolytic subunit [Ruminococcus sp.]